MLIQILRRLQPVFILLALLFIVLLLRSQWQELRTYAWHITPFWLALSVGWLVVAWTLEVAIWRRLLCTVGGQLPYWSALRIWFLSAIVRYIPGNIWQPLSITLLAQQRGVRPEATLTSIVLYQAIITLAVAPIAAVYFAVTGNWGVLTDMMRDVAGWVIAIGLAPVVVFIVQPALLIGVINWALQRMGRSRLPHGLTRAELLFALALAVVDWLVWGAAFASLALGIHADTPTEMWTLAGHLIAVYPVAYVIGFLSLITPSGLGVREGALYLLLAPVIGGATITLLALAMRVWTTLGEVIAAGVSALLPGPVSQLATPATPDPPGASDLRERVT
ncbi:MAG TPA: hypothetical protein DCL15_14000 [Chloroflexi bacterium]|nr:hypothetical protein [Chloroflexota bacterium]HHW88766.1 hypothetical protein [Chloroflexota bacterium]